MRAPYALTAVALLFGVGAAGAGAPAHAAGDTMVLAQASPGGPGPSAGPGVGPSGSDHTGATHPLEAHPARPEFVLACDLDGDGFVSTAEARACDDQRFGHIAGGGVDAVTEQDFVAAMTGTDDPEALFAEIDRDGDGQISREEWLQWRQQGFAGAAAGDRMTVEDYERWDLTGRAVN